MNHDIPSFDDPAQEREWQVQEQARQAERLGLPGTHGDGRVRRYRQLVRTLREPVPNALPADFAQQMAARVGAAPNRCATMESRFELALTTSLVAALLVAAGVVAAIYGHAWLPPFRQFLPHAGAPATGWLLALGGCMAATWLLGWWQRHIPTLAR